MEEHSEADYPQSWQSVQVELFAMLLAGHSAALGRSTPNRRPLSERLSCLLDNFREVRRRTSENDREKASERSDRFRRLMTGHAAALLEYRRQQEARADDFNLLEVLAITYKEIRHSMVLEWLLDHDLWNRGTHAQGRLGFRLFLRNTGLPERYAECRYRVRREVRGIDAIVDIEVACPGQFLIHIENKIHSGEGTDQTVREWEDVKRRAVSLGVNVSSAVHALYLSPRGVRPLSQNFRAVRWGRVVRALEQFSEQAKPVDVRLFAAHYARALRRFIVGRNTWDEERDGNGTSE